MSDPIINAYYTGHYRNMPNDAHVKREPNIGFNSNPDSPPQLFHVQNDQESNPASSCLGRMLCASLLSSVFVGAFIGVVAIFGSLTGGLWFIALLTLLTCCVTCSGICITEEISQMHPSGQC